MNIILQSFIIILGVAGFFIANYIRSHKAKGAPMVCPIGFDCHAVVHSDYSKFFGIPVEVLGMAYYAFIALAYFVFIIASSLVPPSVVGFCMILSGAAFLFSLYLIFVQIFVLRKGCSWCIVSSVISALIWILAFYIL